MDRFVEILNDTFTIQVNKYIGNNVISGIDELNVQLDKSDLSRLIFSRENYEFFKKKENREKICLNLGIDTDLTSNGESSHKTNIFLNALKLKPIEIKEDTQEE